MYSKELIRGTLQPIILTLLREHKRMYGYEITRRVRELTLGKIEITEGALYPTLHKMEADGIVTTEKEFSGKRIRKYYMLSESGTETVEKKVAEFTDYLATMRLILSPKIIG